MATKPDLARRLDEDLKVVADALAALPNMATEWVRESPVSRDVNCLEWRNVMAIVVPLEAAYSAGAMTTCQGRRYLECIDQLADPLPTLKQLKLDLPAMTAGSAIARRFLRSRSGF